MASIRNLFGERRYPFLLTLAFLLLSLLLILLFTDTGTRFSSAYFPSSKDLQPARSVKILPPPVSDPNPSTSLDNSTDEQLPGGGGGGREEEEGAEKFEIQWEICRGWKGSSAVDYIPCLDNVRAIKELKSRRHMEHRERHCPKPSPRCLVPLPSGYKVPVPWSKSRHMNVAITVHQF